MRILRALEDRGLAWHSRHQWRCSNGLFPLALFICIVIGSTIAPVSTRTPSGYEHRRKLSASSVWAGSDQMFLSDSECQFFRNRDRRQSLKLAQYQLESRQHSPWYRSRYKGGAKRLTRWIGLRKDILLRVLSERQTHARRNVAGRLPEPGSGSVRMKIVTAHPCVCFRYHHRRQ